MTTSTPAPLTLSLGGLTYRIECAGNDVLPPAEAAYGEFVQAAADDSEIIRVRLAVEAPAFVGTPLLRTSAHWSILASGEERGILEPARYAARFHPDRTDIEIQCSPALVDPESGAVRSPVHYPLDQLLTMYLLRDRGLIVHSAGMLVRGRGVVLAGVSGAGKTTLARLASGREGWEAISDDRIIVRVDGRLTLHGTPWPGEGNVARDRSGPLDVLLFLAQGSVNAITPIEPRKALPRLLKTVSVPWYDKDYVDRTLHACGSLVAHVRSAVLTFRPDLGAVEAVERFLAG